MSIQARKSIIKMNIHTGMLESLGVNMYTSVGQSLVEFVANAYDADATKVSVSVPFEEIAKERAAIREISKRDGHDMQQGVYDPLPEGVEITIVDNGHGMTVDEMEGKFLAISRNRRKEESSKSESGKRFVMGRKGLGKLAGFGVAGEVKVVSKRAETTTRASISMDFEKISSREHIGDVEFAPDYTDNLPASEQGSTIVLRKLRCDSIKAAEATIRKTLSRNFSHLGEDFELYLNDELVEPELVHYEFTYPPEDKRTEDDLFPLDIETEDGFSYPVLAAVKFRARGESDSDFKRGNLPAKDRGARVYCNGRLAAGPTLFDLPTGMHNFHSQAYMECIVRADVLDQQEVDLISTNRQGFKTDNVIVDAFVEGITDFMRIGIREHGRYRDQQAAFFVENDPESQTILKSIRTLDRRVQKPAEQILRSLAAREGVESEVYREIAPHLVQAINSSEVLVELIKSGTSPADLKTVIAQLADLGEIERSDVLKLYRGRRSGIDALQKLEERSGEKGSKYEKEFHELLKEAPWLIKPEYGNHLTSDAQMGEVARKLNERLKIDNKGSSTSKNRPDLVFVTLDTPSPNLVSIVELKSPNIPLNYEHLSQLEGYITEVKEILEQDYHGRRISVQGHLIGMMARPDSQSTSAKTLARIMKDAGPATQWEVISTPELLSRTRSTHMQVIDALEHDDQD